MKKTLIILMTMTGLLSVHADNYPYLTFEMTDGTKVSVEVPLLTITISGTTLTTGSQSFPFVNLSKMYFSSTNETTGIKALTTTDSDWNDVTDIYDLQGRKVSKEQMHSGQVYIVKTKNGTYKLTAR